MENELTFRTSVGGYRKDEVMEYVENLNDEMFHMKKTYEDEIGKLRVKVQELETLLQQSESNASRLAEEQSARIEKLEEGNADLKKIWILPQENWERLKFSIKKRRPSVIKKPWKNSLLRKNWQKKFCGFGQKTR